MPPRNESSDTQHLVFRDTGEVEGEGDVGPHVDINAGAIPFAPEPAVQITYPLPNNDINLPEAMEIDGGRDDSEQRDSSDPFIVTEDDLRPGDQVFVYRGLIQHHGIVTRVAVRDWELIVEVVHFDPSLDQITRVDLSRFLKGSDGKRGVLRRAKFGSDLLQAAFHHSACYLHQADPPQIVTNRALRALESSAGQEGDGSWGGYSLLTNNCETFACWCSTGRRQTLSRQAVRGVAGATVVVAVCTASTCTGGAVTGALALKNSRRATRVASMVAGVITTILAADWLTDKIRGVARSPQEAER